MILKQKKIPMFILVNSIMLLLMNSQVCAQQDTVQTEPRSGWLNLGIGVSPVGISGGAGMYYSSGTDLISIRYAAISELKVLGPLPVETVWDLGVLYGRRVKASFGVASISGGVAIVGGVRRGRPLSNSLLIQSKYEKLTFHTIGFPVEGQLFLTPTSFFGFGINGFANINRERTFAGVLVCVQVGKFR